MPVCLSVSGSALSQSYPASFPALVAVCTIILGPMTVEKVLVSSYVADKTRGIQTLDQWSQIGGRGWRGR